MAWWLFPVPHDARLLDPLLNNISYLRLHLILQPSDLPNIIPESTEDTLNSNLRTAKAGYFDSDFSLLMQAITEDRRGKSNRSAAKENFLIC